VPYPVSPWEPFALDPVWTGSDLRVRWIYGERFTQLRGVVVGESVENPTRIGVLESGFRPVQPLGFVVAGRRSGWANLIIEVGGAVILLWSPVPSFVVNLVFSLGVKLRGHGIRPISIAMPP
jgi:hypothetical protein